MKRMERWGTGDVRGTGGSANVAVRPPLQRQMQSQLQTQVFGSVSISISIVFSTFCAFARDEARGWVCEGEHKREREKEKERIQEPPSPPVIAMLQTTDDEDSGGDDAVGCLLVGDAHSSSRPLVKLTHLRSTFHLPTPTQTLTLICTSLE
jgi:hypothetical protein